MMSVVESDRPSTERSSKRLLYLLTSADSSSFLQGQLAYLIDRGYEVVVGHGPGRRPGVGSFGEEVTTRLLPYRRDPSLFGDIRSLAATIRFIARHRPNLVNASTPKAGLLGMVAALICRIPSRVYVVRGLRFETEVGLRRHLLRFFESVSMRCATSIIFNSRSLQQLAVSERLPVGQKGRVLAGGSGNGINRTRVNSRCGKSQARVELGLPVEASIVGYVGRLTPDKGVADLVRIFGRLAESHPNAHLLIVGDVDARPASIQATVREIRDNPSIHYLGRYDDVGVVYSAMDLLLFPSYREGLPNVPLEAQYCNRPVVAYAATGTVDSVNDGNTGILVPVGDEEAMYREALALLEDHAKMQKLGGFGNEWIRSRFSSEVIWRLLEEHYAAWT